MKIAGITIIFTVLVAYCNANDQVSLTITKATYCACACCEPNPNVCFRHASIPAEFKCDKKICTEEFCTTWNQAKCMKDCFCNECKDKIPANDARCASFKKLPVKCKCRKDINCEEEGSTSGGGGENIEDTMKHITSSAGKKQCVIPCFCRQCKGSIPPYLQEQCSKTKKLPKDCECGKFECPSEDMMRGLRTMKNLAENNPQKKKKDDKKGPDKMTQNIDDYMTTEQAKKTKCNLKCFCNICGEKSEEIKKSCDNMVPSGPLEDCDCEKEKVECPMSDEYTECTLWCFCRGCKNDPRMPISVIQSCQHIASQETICKCKEKEDCDALDQLQGLSGEPKPEKKKGKKGRFKSKKTKDEL